mmetsp:Transcript_43288/g.51941  ORF Transcript_43288/g.51941 Transcript_43288/m.51941 type:complete len:104 (-) Transcript_43288:111-422(-)
MLRSKNDGYRRRLCVVEMAETATGAANALKVVGRRATRRATWRASRTKAWRNDPGAGIVAIEERHAVFSQLEQIPEPKHQQQRGAGEIQTTRLEEHHPPPQDR